MNVWVTLSVQVWLWGWMLFLFTGIYGLPWVTVCYIAGCGMITGMVCLLCLSEITPPRRPWR